MNDLLATLMLALFTGLICFGRELFCRRWRLLGVVLSFVGTVGLILVYCSIQ